MEKFLNLLLSGAVTGAIYSLIAAGLALTYSTTGIFNLGYGAVAFTSAFVYFELHSGLGWPIPAAAFVTVCVFAPLLGLVLDRAIFRALTKASESAKIMATVGVLVALPALAKWIVELLISAGHFVIPDGNQVFVPPGIGPALPKVWHLGKLNFDSNQLIVFVVAAVSTLVLWFVISRTTLGLRMRAVVDRPELAQLRGIDRGRSSATAWILGTVLAGVAGVIGAPIFNSLDPGTYTQVMFVATAAVVLGGLRSVPLAYAGGMLVGILQNLVAGYANVAGSIRGFNSAAPFVLLLVGLAVWGRDRSRRAGFVTEDVPPPDYSADMQPWRRAAGWVVGVGLILLYISFIADRFWIGLATRGLALALVFLSFVIVTGMGGMVSLAQAAFVTAAGLTAGLLVDRYHAPFVVGVLGGMAVAVLLGVVVALPALRLGGLPLALATLALGYVGDRVLFQWDWLRNKNQGWPIHRPSLGWIHLADDRSLAIVLVGLVLLVTLLIRNLQHSASGRAMVAVRSSEPASSTSGISPSVVKLTLFAISAALAGLGGILLFAYDQHVSSASYTTDVGLVWLATVVLWGVRRPSAAIIAGLTSAMLPTLLSGGFHWPSFIPSFLSWRGTKSIWLPSVLFGLGAIQMAQNPDGILAVIAEGGYKRRKKRRERVKTRGAREALRVPRAGMATGAGSPPIRVPRPAMAGGASCAPGGDGPMTAPPAAGLLTVQNVSAGYGEIGVLFDLDLRLPQASITALVGPNGAGKTTLCKVLSGLTSPTAGCILFDGKDITTLRADRRAGAILLAPESRGVFPSLSVEDNLTLRLPSTAQRDQVYERFTALRERRRLPAGSLSGGEQQMLAMASVLVRPPRVLIVDEPMLGLAPLVVNDILAIFRELRDDGVTLLLVEEQAHAVLDTVDNVALLELGRIVWFGPRRSLDEEQLAAIYMGRS